MNRGPIVLILAALLPAALLLGGCTMIPKYERPAPPVPDAWADEAPTKAEPAAAPAPAVAPAAAADLRRQGFFPEAPAARPRRPHAPGQARPAPARGRRTGAAAPRGGAGGGGPAPPPRAGAPRHT